MPVTQSDNVAPKIDASTKTELKLIGKVGPFSIYSGITKKSMSAKQVYGMSVDVAAEGQNPGVGFWKLWNKDA